ncbi:MAG: S8 family peptidase [Lachnospiraceae bacterium]|nr:S8 family peptidase [Lachnospiraceae bacterium]
MENERILKSAQLEEGQLNGTEECRERILSEDYEDFIFPANQIYGETALPQLFCVEQASDTTAVIHVSKELLPPLSVQFYNYAAIPRLYGLTDVTNMEASGILRARNQPVLGLDGKGVLIGLIDTGIDYTNPVFMDEFGGTRILRIWDQTVQTGRLPEGFQYGSEYTKEEIDEAIASSESLSLVPSVDEDGHGTFLASIAAGSDMPEEEFTGAAPGASIAMVKLKPAKEYLRKYFLIRDGATAYQETDLMMGVRYLTELGERLAMPLVILIGVGTNWGDHAGNAPLGCMLNTAARQLGNAVVVAAGNESNRAHHYFGTISAEGGNDYVEIRVPQNENGITMELWAQAPEVYSVQILSPTGESTGRVVPRLNLNSVFQFTMEKTVIYVDYQLIEQESGSTVVRMRMADPTPGIWTLAVYNEQYTDGRFHIWLPMEGFVEEDTAFLRPNPDTTLTVPSSAEGPITFGADNHRQNSLYIHSGRGYTRTNCIKPDLVAPGVDIYGALPGGRFGVKSGTSIAAAHGAGAAALLLEWGTVQGNYRGMRTKDIKSLMIRGAIRSRTASYPNRGSGYGALDVFHIFETISL